MAGSKEARLIMRLVDGVSAPGRAIAATLGTVNKAVRGITSVAALPSRALGAMARDARRRVNDVTVLSAGLSLGIAEVSKNVYDLEKNLNKSQAAGELSLGQRNDLLQQAIKLNYEYAATASEIVGGANELLRSGLSYDQTIGAMRAVFDTAQAMDVPFEQASAAIVEGSVALKLNLSTMEDTLKSTQKLADLYAYAMRETAKAELIDFQTSGKYFNPVAAAIGMSPEETMAYQIALAKAGIYGSSAGTGLRAAPVRIAAPSKKGLEAFARLGINPQDFVGKRVGGATGDTVAAALEASGFEAEGIEAGIDKLMQDPRLRKSPAKLANAIIDSFGDEMGATTGQDRTLISKTIQDALAAGVSKIDLHGVLKAMHDKGAGVADYAAIFGLHHASKMQAIDLDILEYYLEKTKTESVGLAKTMRELMMQGIVRAWNEFTASIEAISVAIGKSGLLEDANRQLRSLTQTITSLAEVNPELLKFAAYATLGLAALAPLGFAITGITSALALLVNPLTLVVGALGALAYLNWDFLTRSFTAFSTGFMDNLDPKIVEGVAAGFERIKAVFTGEPMKFDAGWSKFFVSLGKGTADGINATVAAAERFVQIARDIADSDIGQAFGGAMNSLFNMLGEGGGAAARTMGALADGAQSFWTAFSSNVSPGTAQTINDALVGVMNAYSNAYDRMAEMFRGVDFDITDAAARAGAWSAGVVNELTSFFAGIDLVEEGRKIITSLLDGLRQGWQSVKDTLSGWKDEIANVFSFGNTDDPQASQSDWDRDVAGNKTPIEPVLNYEVLRQDTEQAAGQVKNALSVTATPIVDSSSIDAAIGKAATLRSLLGGSGGRLPTLHGATGKGLSTYGGPRAGGGPVARGMNYLVGENGPELFSPGSSGTITPNHALGGSSTKITNHFNIQGGNAEEVVRKVMHKLDQQLMRSRQVAIDGRPQYEFG